MRLKKVDRVGVEKLISYIAANPIESELPGKLMQKAKELGYNPRELIDTALGHVKLEKSNAKLSDNPIDILNSIYENDPTPGRRYVIDPLEAISERGKHVAKSLQGNVGFAESLNIGRSRSLPDFAAVKMPYNDIEKLKSIADAGHELQHNTDWLIRPDLKIYNPNAYEEKHHWGPIYETSELNREVRNLPKDEKVVKEIIKQNKKVGLKPSSFGRLLSLLGKVGPIGAGVSAISALKSGDVGAAALNAASAIDPTGVSDTALEIKNRLKMNPEEQEQTAKEDRYSAMPMDIANEQRMLDELDRYDDKYKKIREKVK